jgi:uncharacterized protein (DUF1778 family)
MTRKTSKRIVTITVRAEKSQWAVIDRAAAAGGKSRSEFMLDAAWREAISGPPIQRLFVLDAAAYRRFVKALDRPPAPNRRLRLHAAKVPWR